MADENGNEDNNPFASFQTHEVDGKSLSTAEGSQQPETKEESNDGGTDTDTSEDAADESGDDGSSQELDESGVGDGEDTDSDEDDDHGEGEGDPGESEAEGEAADSGDDNEGEDGDGEGKPKKKSVRERIGEMTKARRTAERATEAANARADTAENALAAVEARLAKLEKGSTSDDDDGSEENSGQSSALTPPNPDDYDYGEMDPKYIAAFTDYRMDLREEKNRATNEETRQQEAEQQQAVELQTAMDDTIAVGAEAYDDFEDVVVKAVDEGDLPLSPAMAFMGVNSPVGHHVLYQIANDLPLAKRLVAMEAHEQIAEFGRLSAQYTDEGGTKPKPNKTPQATPPPSGRKGQKGPKKVNAATSNFADFEQMANAELAKQPKRF